MSYFQEKRTDPSTASGSNNLVRNQGYEVIHEEDFHSIVINFAKMILINEDDEMRSAVFRYFSRNNSYPELSKSVNI